MTMRVSQSRDSIIMDGGRSLINCMRILQATIWSSIWNWMNLVRVLRTMLTLTLTQAKMKTTRKMMMHQILKGRQQRQHRFHPNRMSNEPLALRRSVRIHFGAKNAPDVSCTKRCTMHTCVSTKVYQHSRKLEIIRYHLLRWQLNLPQFCYRSVSHQVPTLSEDIQRKG